MTVITHKKPQSTPDDIKMINQITDAHKPDVNAHVKDDLLGMAQDILGQATTTLPAASQTNSEVPEGKPRKDISKGLALTIHKIGCQLLCNCAGGEDMKSITQGVFNTLVGYSWEDKVAIALSAFSTCYGEFCLVSQLHATNPLAKYVVHLKPLPDIKEREILIRDLLKVVVNVTKTIIELNGLRFPCISREQPPLSEALNEFPAAAYWAIKGIVTCSSESIGLMDIDPQYILSICDARQKLTDVTRTLEEILEHLQSKLSRCKEMIKEYEDNKAYHDLQDLIKRTHTDNMEILVELIPQGDNKKPLFNGGAPDCAPDKLVGLDVLKSKTVILFISYWDMSIEEVKEVEKKIGNSEGRYEIVWLPIDEELVEPNKMKAKEINRKAKLVKRYSLDSSITLKSHVIKYIKEDWHFEEEPLLVVLNEKGKVVRSNAYHMAMIWGSAAYPFDIQHEITLWKKPKWNLEFLIEEVVTSCDKTQLGEDGKLICLFGGNDLNWTNLIICKAKEVVKWDGIVLEFIQVGKKHVQPMEGIQIKHWDEPQKIRRFRDRLNSIMYSIMQPEITITNKGDILKDVMMLLGAHGSGQGWTIVGKFGSEYVNAVSGNIMMASLEHIKTKGVGLTSENLYTTLRDVTVEVTPNVDKHCNHISIASNSGINRKEMVCVHCRGRMQKYTTYKCCPNPSE